MAVNEVILNGETLVSLVNDTVTADKLLDGVTAHNAEGEPIEGNAVIPTRTSQLTNDSGFVAVAAKTTDEWADETEIPAKGTICVEVTAEGETKLKIGDGVSAFSGLKYVDCGNADTLDGKHASDFASSTNPTISGNINLIRENSGTINSIFAWGNSLRLRVCKTDETSGDSYTDIIVMSTGIFVDSMKNGVLGQRKKIADGGNAASVGGVSVQSNAGTLGLHQMCAGTAAASTTNCPVGCWYGQYS